MRNHQSHKQPPVTQREVDVAHMDQVTQRNAPLREQAAPAPASLALEAGGLTQAVSLFKFGRATPARRPVPTARQSRPAARLAA